MFLSTRVIKQLVEVKELQDCVVQQFGAGIKRFRENLPRPHEYP